MSEHSAFFIMGPSNLLPFHLICKVFHVTLFARHHICTKDPSLNRNNFPAVFNKLLKPPRQLELPHSSIPLPKVEPSLLGLSTQKKINTSHLLDLHLQ